MKRTQGGASLGRSGAWNALRSRALLVSGLVGCVAGVIALGIGSAPVSRAEPAIYASPIQASCYQSRPDRCRLHVEPITLNLASGRKLAQFRLVAIRQSTSVQTVIYDFRPDLSNPAPFSGTTYSPTQVKRDFAADCQQAYTLVLQGQDTGDATLYNLGMTGTIACPVGTFTDWLPRVTRR